jgi:hypothetical protein
MTYLGRRSRRAVLATLALAAGTALANPCAGQPLPQWTFRALSGWYRNDNRVSGIAFDGGLARRFGVVALGAEVLVGVGSPGFAIGSVTVELHPGWRSGFDPFLGGGTGILSEPGGLGLPLFARAGADFRPGNRAGLRLMAQFGKHPYLDDPGSDPGPHLIMVGVVLKI